MISPTREQELHPLPVMPWPAQVKVSPSPSYLVVDTSFAVGLDSHADVRLRKTVAMFLNDLRRRTGMLPLDFSITTPEKAQTPIHCELPTKHIPNLTKAQSHPLHLTPSA